MVRKSSRKATQKAKEKVDEEIEITKTSENGKEKEHQPEKEEESKMGEESNDSESESDDDDEVIIQMNSGEESQGGEEKEAKEIDIPFDLEYSDEEPEQKEKNKQLLKRTLDNTFANREERNLESALFNGGKKEKISFDIEIDSGNAEEETGPIPAWEDEDEDEYLFSLASTNRLRKLRKTETENEVTGSQLTQSLREKFTETYSAHQEWSTKFEKQGENSILQWAGGLIKTQSQRLPKSILDVTRMKDANIQGRSQAVVQSLKFHPSSQILMTAGLDKTVRLFNVDGKDNELIQKMHFENFPIYSSVFSGDGKEIFCSGRRPFFYSYDLGTGTVTKIARLQGRKEKSLESMFISPDGAFLVFLGEAGSLLLVDSHTKRLISTLKMNGTVRSITFSDDSNYMYSFGGDGEVYVWDLPRRVCIHKFRDEGCLSGTSIAAASDYLICGSRSGIINIYNASDCLKEKFPKPQKAIMNLTTQADVLKLNHDAQILCIASKQQRDSMKMVHLPSMSVFQNWPTESTPLRYIHSVDFSPNSGYISMGNDRGNALLYRLNHYNLS